MNFHQLRVIASQEFTVMLRTRWVGGFGLLFLCLISAFAWFGTADIGIAGVQDFSRTSVTLVNLVCAIAPLMALMIGLHAFTIERGAEELLLSQPVSRTVVLLGKAIGVYLTLALSTMVGFGFSGAIIAARVGSEGVLQYVLFVLLTLVLQMAFLSVALLISGFLRHRIRAVGTGLAVWFFFVLLYDLLVIGSTVVLKGRLLQQVLFAALFLNPVDLIRVSQLVSLNGTAVFGAAGAVWVRTFGGDLSLVLMISATVFLWIVLPAVIGVRAFNRRDF